MDAKATAGNSGLLTKKEVGAMLKISEGTIGYLFKTRQLQGLVVARKLRFRPEAVEEYIRNCEKKD